MTITAIETITIPVADQDVALAFYRDVLGFEVTGPDGVGSGLQELAHCLCHTLGRLKRNEVTGLDDA